MFFRKNQNATQQFEESLNNVMADPEVASNEKLLNLFKTAAVKVEKNDSVSSIASNLAHQLQSNFGENELPKSVIDFQLTIQKYSDIGANGIIL